MQDIKFYVERNRVQMSKKSIIGAGNSDEIETIDMEVETVHKTNGVFWNTVGSEFLGVTALPSYGAFVSEEKLQFLTESDGKKILEIGCGNGHSLEYMAQYKETELWGLDLAPMQIERTKDYLMSKGIDAHLVCSPMEAECVIPKEYFDLIYSVYAIGWTTDLDQTFGQIASYLKKDGTFIFSWSHPIHKCVSMEDGKLIFSNSYFDESWYSVSIENTKLMLANRKLSTYINALAKAGFVIEQLVEESDEEILKQSNKDAFAEKAKMLPVAFVIKARKL